MLTLRHCLNCADNVPFFLIPNHCVKSAQIFRPNTGKYGPEITPYLGTFHTVECLTFINSKYQICPL